MKVLIVFLIITLVLSVYTNIYLIGEHYESKTELLKEVRAKEKAESFIEIIRQLEEDGSYTPPNKI